MEAQNNPAYQVWFGGTQFQRGLDKAYRLLGSAIKHFLNALSDITQENLRTDLLNYANNVYETLFLSYKLYSKETEWEVRRGVLLALGSIKRVKYYLSNPQFYWHETRLKQMFDLLIYAKEQLDPHVSGEKNITSVAYFFTLEDEILTGIRDIIQRGDILNSQRAIESAIEEMEHSRQFIIDLQYDLLGSENEIDISELVRRILHFQIAIIEALRDLRAEDVQVLLDQYKIILDEGRTLLTQLERNPNLKMKFSINPNGRSSGGASTPDELRIPPKTLKLMLSAIHPTNRKGVKDVVRGTGFSNSTVRGHLSKMADAGLIEFEKDGKYNFYKRTGLGTEVLQGISENEPFTRKSRKSKKGDVVRL
jgi:DNA-binding transcriptional ArsR family regulator